MKYLSKIKLWLLEKLLYRGIIKVLKSMPKNTGVITGKRPEDYVAGRVGASIPYEERNPSANWKPYLPKGEWQRMHTPTDVRETMACVSFSALNSIETQIKHLTGKEINLSDRFTAKMSGTTTRGNHLYTVGDSIRKDGAVPESVWPWPDNFSWNEYYKEIPQEIKDMGKRFLEAVDIKYEWVPLIPAEIKKHLRQSPLQTVILNNTHAVLTFATEEDVNHYFDQYEPFIKSREELTWPMKYVVTIKDEDILDEFIINKKTMQRIIHKPTGEQYLRNDKGEDIHIVGGWSLKYLTLLPVENPHDPIEVDEVNEVQIDEEGLSLELTFIPYNK